MTRSSGRATPGNRRRRIGYALVVAGLAAVAFGLAAALPDDKVDPRIGELEHVTRSATAQLAVHTERACAGGVDWACSVRTVTHPGQNVASDAGGAVPPDFRVLQVVVDANAAGQADQIAAEYARVAPVGVEHVQVVDGIGRHPGVLATADIA